LRSTRRPPKGEEQRAPHKEVLVHFGDEERERGETELLGGEREPEVGLGKTFHAATQDGLDILDDADIHVHGHERALMKVDAEAGGAREALEQPAHTASRCHIHAEDQKRVINVLKDGARSTIHKGVLEDVVGLDQSLKHIGGDDEEEVR
jgi:hypothetical protein